MRGLARKVAGVVRRLARGEGGTATVEFVILFPAFILVMTNAIEGSVVMMRWTMLDRGLDMAVRELRLSAVGPPGFEEFRDLVCAFSTISDDDVEPEDDPALAACKRDLHVELVPVEEDGTWTPLEDLPACADREEEIDPMIDPRSEHYQTGLAQSLMMVRVCVAADPLLPNFGLGAMLPKDAAGRYSLVAVSAFVREPDVSRVGT